MNKNDAVEQWTEANKSVEIAQKKISELKDKREKLGQQKEQLLQSSLEAGAAKEKALEEFIQEKIKKDVLDQAKDKCKQASREASDVEEIIVVLDRALSEAEHYVPRCTADLRAAERQLWCAIFDELVDDIRSTVGDKVMRAFVANLGAGQLYRGVDFFVKVIGDEPRGTDQIQKIQAEVFAEAIKNVK